MSNSSNQLDDFGSTDSNGSFSHVLQSKDHKKGGNWGSKWEFLLSCVGLSVGLGNVWRFPFLAYQNGGGAFLIPYIIMLVLAGKPLYFMELAFGQFVSERPLRVWNCAPIAKGVGASMVAISLVVCIYYNVIMSYALFFIRYSFSSPLPWQTCDPSWAEGINCVIRERNSSNFTGDEVPSSQVFWERKVLDISPSIHDLGGIKWDNLVCHLISWLIVGLCVVKGVKSVGKVIYFTATFPYVILFALLIAGVIQEGAWNGIRYFIEPDWDKLWQLDVWQAAAGQMFFSLSISMGGLIMFSSNNDFKHNVFKDAFIVSILDTLTSIIAGIVIFSVLGAMAHELNLPIDKVVSGGFGLAFIVYPEALTRLPFPQLWSVLFFFMLFCLGLDSEFALLENVISSIGDDIKIFRRHKLKLCIGVCIFCFLIGLPCVTRGGLYVIDMMDHFGGSLSLIFIGFFECVSLMWIYGYKRFAFDINYMLNRKLGCYWRFTWVYTSPIILAFIFIFYLIDFQPLGYENYGNYNWIGIGITLFIILQVPIWALIVIYKQKIIFGQSFTDKLRLSIRVNQKWGPKDEEINHDWRVRYNEFKINEYSNKLDIQKTISSELRSVAERKVNNKSLDTLNIAIFS